ncbi:MAG: bifunctional diguanylate cyclase/phosphodiesterase [Acidiferrobacter sp.]
MAEHRRPRRVLLGTLRSRLVALALVSAIPALALLIYAMQIQYRETRQSIEGQELAACRAAAAPQQAFVNRGHATLSLIAALPLVHQRAVCQRFFTRFLHTHPLYVNFGVTGPHGWVRCSAVPLPHPVNLANRPYFHAARDSGDFALGGYEIGRISGRRLFVLAQPVHVNGRFDGVVFGAVGLQALDRFEAHIPRPPHATLVVLDASGRLLADYPRSPQKYRFSLPAILSIVGHHGIGKLTDRAGHRVIFGFRALTFRGHPYAYVGVGTPQAWILRKSERTLILDVLAFVMALTFALILAWWGGERMLFGPLRALRTAANDVAHGDLTVRTGLEGAAELTDLSHAFDHMTASLEAISGRYALILNAAGEGICGVGPDGTITFANPAAESILHCAAGQLLGVPLRELCTNAGTLGVASTEASHSGVGTVIARDGMVLLVDYTTSPLWQHDDYAGAVITFQDISGRRAAEERVRYLAHYDPLTGLPNRRLCVERITDALRAADSAEELVVVALLDIDRFRTINDSLGHEVGDSLLQAVATALRVAVGEAHLLARVSGDEFVIVGRHAGGVADIEILTTSLIAVFSQPFEVGARELFLTASIGAVIYPFIDGTAEDLLRAAAVAVHRAKQAGRHSCQFYHETMSGRAFDRLALENGLRYAIERNELSLHYQPLVVREDGRIFGVEALLRWHSPTLGDVPPTRFISLAEDSGLIIPLGEWVIMTACQQAVRWHEQGLPLLKMAVNLSPRQFLDGDVVATVRHALEVTGLDPTYLECEITEGLLMDQTQTVTAALHGLHRLGVALSIDDFGTGYSSLSYLRRFPIDTLKIDQSFTRDVPTDPDAAAIIGAIMALASALGLNVIAEGVETIEQLVFLGTHHCNKLQGFYFSRPLPAAALAQLYEEHSGHLSVPADRS